MAVAPSRGSSILFLLRLEGLVVAVATAVLFARTGASWWLFALWLAPDLSMLGYLAGPCQGARVYNAFHTYVGPGVLALCSLMPGAHTALPLALIWANHIGDRPTAGLRP